MRLLPTLMILALAAPSALADDTKVERIDIIDAGVYENLVFGEAIEDPNLPGEKLVSVDKADLVEATTTVKGQVGGEFGLRYKVVGEPDGQPVTLEFRFVYPSPGLMDPEQDEPLTESRFARQRTIGKTEYTGYGFESDWEVVPGDWTIEISHDGKKLAEQTFTVTE